MNIIKDPEKIAQKSFSLIKDLMGVHSFTEEELPVVIRIIHSTGDPEFGKEVQFSKGAISAGVTALKNGCSIITDVNMVRVGISKPLIQSLGCTCSCYVADEDIVAQSKQQNITRSELAMKKAKPEIQNGVIAIGNAPTALFELIRMIQEEKVSPALVVGFPVGFVGAEESKRELVKLDVPFISNVTKRGGTPVAVSAINALLKLATA